VQFSDLQKRLAILLNETLPGKEFHQKMKDLTPLKDNSEPNEFTKRSAVLILLYPDKNEIKIPLILRPPYDGTHGGQMSFPGGKVELEDESLIRTALREAQEEIGIKAIDVHVLGKLTEIYIPPSNFLVLPVIGYLNYTPDFYPDAKEVEEIVNVSIEEMQNEAVIEIREIVTKKFKFKTQCYVLQEKIVWGATALMVAELNEILKRK
jgi:8-oxo-dGTP pyrophosphatase MutT (NUDIX family)